MKTQDAIKHAGSAANLAKLLGITPGAVSQWGDVLPEARIWQLKNIRPRWFKATKPTKEVA